MPEGVVSLAGFAVFGSFGVVLEVVVAPNGFPVAASHIRTVRS